MGLGIGLPKLFLVIYEPMILCALCPFLNLSREMLVFEDDPYKLFREFKLLARDSNKLQQEWKGMTLAWANAKQV